MRHKTQLPIFSKSQETLILIANEITTNKQDNWLFYLSYFLNAIETHDIDSGRTGSRLPPFKVLQSDTFSIAISPLTKKIRPHRNVVYVNIDVPKIPVDLLFEIRYCYRSTMEIIIINNLIKLKHGVIVLNNLEFCLFFREHFLAKPATSNFGVF